MSPLKQLIKTEALRLGFAQCGFSRSDSLEFLRPFYTDFIRRKGHADIQYLETNLEKRLNPQLVMEGARSVIALLFNYYPPEIIPEEENFIISKYAYGADYHVVMRERLNALIHYMKSSSGDQRIKGFVDSGVLLEKTWAQKCGVGWQGKNTLLINKSSGSFFFIGIILTSLEIEPDQPETDHCGNCSKCVSACPTGALSTPFQLDIPRCISYITIEQKEEITSAMKGKLSDRIYGCDICQDVCPYNNFARPHQFPGFLPSETMLNFRKEDWIGLTEAEFNRVFEKSAVKRVGYRRFMRGISS
ncbi:MAG: tRNA epoxyqueuosine(34) reductase QueG [Bacteroidales bacterium]